mmetsp:Transcript_17017/g.53068  ORF Transcript_17017/g.53068 Transcript_17017/m.53068 type:complete len:460 (+) Transcript_17017:669-2048(+)
MTVTSDAADAWGLQWEVTEAPAAKICAVWAPDSPAARHELLDSLEKDTAARHVAPPVARLALVLANCHTLDAQRRADALRGEAWRSSDAIAIAPRCGAARNSAGARTAPLVDAPAQLRMRALPLCRLAFGTHAPETLEAAVNVAAAYANVGLWPQAAARAESTAAALNAATSASPSARAAASADADAAASAATASAILRIFDALAAAAAARGGGVPWRRLVSALAASGDARLAAQPWGVLEGGHRAPRRPDIEGSSELQWGEAVSFLRRVHAGFAAAARQLERTAPAHALAALASAFAVTATASRASVARAVDLREAIVASRPAAAAFAGSAFAGWLRGRIADADRRGTAAAPIAWEECVAALVVDHAGRGTGARLAELTARCRIISGGAAVRRHTLPFSCWGRTRAALCEVFPFCPKAVPSSRAANPPRRRLTCGTRSSSLMPLAGATVRLLPMRTRH